MKNRASVIELVERAPRGDTKELNHLAGAVKVRLYEYTVRMTLDEQLAEDVEFTLNLTAEPEICLVQCLVDPKMRHCQVGWTFE